jgi:hypothetical protein
MPLKEEEDIVGGGPGHPPSLVAAAEAARSLPTADDATIGISTGSRCTCHSVSLLDGDLCVRQHPLGVGCLPPLFAFLLSPPLLYTILFVVPLPTRLTPPSPFCAFFYSAMTGGGQRGLDSGAALSTAKRQRWQKIERANETNIQANLFTHKQKAHTPFTLQKVFLSSRHPCLQTKFADHS